jgi:hypothetical protein
VVYLHGFLKKEFAGGKQQFQSRSGGGDAPVGNRILAFWPIVQLLYCLSYSGSEGGKKSKEKQNERKREKEKKTGEVEKENKRGMKK